MKISENIAEGMPNLYLKIICDLVEYSLQAAT